MNADEKVHHTAVPQVLREMLLRLQNETYRRIKDLRRDQEQESESEPTDELDSANTTAEVETHAAPHCPRGRKTQVSRRSAHAPRRGRVRQMPRLRAPIPIERLTAIPFASHCVDCRDKRNRARQGWGEGTTIAPYDHQWTAPEEMQELKEPDNRSTAPEEQLTVHSGETLASEPRNQTKRIVAKNRHAGAGNKQI